MEDFDSTLSLLSILGPIMGGVSVIMVALMLWAPLVLYVLARWRAHRDPHPDPQLGLKFALYYFATLGAQLVIVGTATFLFVLVSASRGDKGEVYRIAFGLILAGGITLGAYLALRGRTNDAQYPGVRRLYNGFQLMITGAVTFIALVAACELLLKRGETYGAGRAAVTFLLVYGAATALFAWRAAQLSGGSRDAGSSYPPSVVTPIAPAAGLPPLGGGAYPPIEPR